MAQGCQLRGVEDGCVAENIEEKLRPRPGEVPDRERAKANAGAGTAGSRRRPRHGVCEEIRRFNGPCSMSCCRGVSTTTQQQHGVSPTV